jgi:carbon monoxide dehydrogenase subunit G
MPGAELQEVDGDEYRGIVKVKVGPISAQYQGTAKIIEKDDEHHRAVLRAEGRETRGQGNASATVTATVTPDNDGAVVSIVTDLSITGKVAQFGRSVMGDVSTKLLGQFAERLEADVLSQASSLGTDDLDLEEPPPPRASADGQAPGSVRPVNSAPAEPIDLVGTAGFAVLKRAAPVLVFLVVGILLVRWRRRR